jgi:hypothetical protein
MGMRDDRNQARERLTEVMTETGFPAEWIKRALERFDEGYVTARDMQYVAYLIEQSRTLTIERVNAKAKSEATAEASVLHSRRAIGPLILLLKQLDPDTVKLHLSPLLQDPKPEFTRAELAATVTAEPMSASGRFTRAELAAIIKDLMDAGISLEDM